LGLPDGHGKRSIPVTGGDGLQTPQKSLPISHDWIRAWASKNMFEFDLRGPFVIDAKLFRLAISKIYLEATRINAIR
jgi:hypothetical protein